MGSWLRLAIADELRAVVAQGLRRAAIRIDPMRGGMSQEERLEMRAHQEGYIAGMRFLVEHAEHLLRGHNSTREEIVTSLRYYLDQELEINDGKF